jgi:hypothetical protein
MRSNRGEFPFKVLDSRLQLTLRKDLCNDFKYFAFSIDILRFFFNLEKAYDFTIKQ